MNETITQSFLFFALAFLSGLFWPAFHAMIGSPESVPDESAGIGAQFVKTLKISKPGMIFRRYGEWLCRKQNEWEKRYDKSLLYEATLPADIKSVMDVLTSYGRLENEVVTARVLVDNHEKLQPDEWRVSAKLYPNEHAHIVYINKIGKQGQSVFKPLFPDFNRSRMPLSPYKALGLCQNCTVFWIMLFTLVSACFVGLFPPAYFWLILPAYGLAMWGTTVYE